MLLMQGLRGWGELEEEYVEDESQGEEEAASMRQRLLRCLLQESKN